MNRSSTIRRQPLQIDTLTSTDRSKRRISAILEEATEIFLRDGYEKASLDEIVKRAGGSKATVYKYFKNKRELFFAVVDSVVRGESERPLENADSDPERVLKDYAKRRIKVVFSPEHVALMRLVITEGRTSPDVAAGYYLHGPGNSHKILIGYLRQQVEQQTLRINDIEQAAHDFMALVMHKWYLKILQGGEKLPSGIALDKSINTSIETFMRLYRA